jgi:hypothetical protein
VVRSAKHWSGRRDSNPRPRPWQGRAPASTPCRTALLLSIKRSRGSERCNTICNTNRKSDRAKNAKSTRFYWLSCGRRIVVIQQLPKLHTRVRFPSPAPKLNRILTLSRVPPIARRQAARRSGKRADPRDLEYKKKRPPAAAFLRHPRCARWLMCRRGCSMYALPFRQSLRQ